MKKNRKKRRRWRRRIKRNRGVTQIVITQETLQGKNCYHFRLNIHHDPIRSIGNWKSFQISFAFEQRFGWNPLPNYTLVPSRKRASENLSIYFLWNFISLCYDQTNFFEPIIRDFDRCCFFYSNLDANDFISRLPNNILYQIISLLPFRSAVRTTFLSTQWKDLWKEIVLDSVHDVTMERVVVIIFRFLNDFAEQHGPRNKWGFRINFG